jgi:hypothetical protein
MGRKMPLRDYTLVLEVKYIGLRGIKEAVFSTAT